MASKLLQYIQSNLIVPDVIPEGYAHRIEGPYSSQATATEDNEYIYIDVTGQFPSRLELDSDRYYEFERFFDDLVKRNATSYITESSSNIPHYDSRKADILIDSLITNTTTKVCSYRVKIPKNKLALNDFIWLDTSVMAQYLLKNSKGEWISGQDVFGVGAHFAPYGTDGHQQNVKKIRLSDPYLFNQTPTAVTIPTQSTQLGTNKTVNLSSYFSDPDGDAMTYTASSSNTAVGTVTVSGSTLTLTPKALGSTTITVTANDGKGGTKSTTFTFSVVNSAPTVSLNAPLANQTLYENDVFNLAGTASDTDNGNSVTIRYQINANTARAIKAFVSNGSTAEAFSRTLTFKGGNLYDGDTLIASNLADGVPHTLKVWATDDQGGTSVIAERAFYAVPNRAPRLGVTPPTIEGNIDSDTFTVSGTYADDDKNEVIISYRINGNVSKEVARGTDGAFDFMVSFAQLKNGNNTISVEAIDSYGAKTSRTIKLNKNTIATPLLQSTVRYLIKPPKGSAQAVLLWLQRDQDLAVTASLHMGMKGEAEAFTLLEPTNTAPLRDNAAILEDEFYHEADSAKDHIILQLDMLRSSVESTAAIHLISGVFE